MSHKRVRSISLTKLETRFLLNLVLPENNKLVHPKYVRRGLSKTNMFNIGIPITAKVRAEYKERMSRLLGKIWTADRKFCKGGFQ